MTRGKYEYVAIIIAPANAVDAPTIFPASQKNAPIIATTIGMKIMYTIFRFFHHALLRRYLIRCDLRILRSDCPDHFWHLGIHDRGETVVEREEKNSVDDYERQQGKPEISFLFAQKRVKAGR